jgi:hypothetical protein
VTVRVEREGRPIELIRDADLAVLNGLDHETERWCRRVEPIRERRVDPAEEGYGLVGDGAERLSHYDPGGFPPLKALRRLERAGLVKPRRVRQHLHYRWFVTADGDALLEDRGDELPGALCESCWTETELPRIHVDPQLGAAVPEAALPRFAGMCASCAITVLDAAYDQAKHLQRYAAAATSAIEALPDE